MADIKLVIRIPEDFVKDWNDTKFDDCFKRIRADLNDYRKSNGYGTSGIYEDEIIDMLDNAFCTATPFPKGRGRMIILSEDAVKREQVMPLSFSHQKWISEVGLSMATVAIIDTESEVEE